MRGIAVVMPLLALGATEPTALPRPANPPIATPIAPPVPDCRTLHPAATNDKATFHRLGDLPPANLYLTVLRSIDRCPAPVMTGYGSMQGPRPGPSR